MVVGADTTNPNLASIPYAAARTATGVWSVIDTTALGARAMLAVTHAGTNWYATTNGPGPLNGFVGVSADGAPPAAFTAVDSGQPDHLCAIDHNSQFAIASLFGNIITAPTDLSSFSSHSANGPGSYVPVGVATNGGATSYVCVGLGGAPTGICQSPDGATWTNQAANYSTENDFLVTSNTVLWTGTQFFGAEGNQVGVSVDGQTWTLSAMNATDANVVAFDAVNGLYYVGDTDGNVYVSATIAGLATAPPNPISLNNLRCAASFQGVTLVGDDGGGVFVTTNGGATWSAETTGLGPIVLTGASGRL